MNRIRDLRKKRSWMQEDLAKALNITRQAVGHYETEIRSLDVETIHKLCDIFGCTSDYLLGRSGVERFDLSEEELALLGAWRCADDDAQTMVRLALKRWIPADNEKDAAV